MCCLRACLGVLLQLVGYLLRLCWALLLPRAVVAAKLLAVQSQLAAGLNHSSAQRKRHRQFSPAFQILWAVLSKSLEGWETLAQLMKPETVKRWHTRAFRGWWRWKSKPGRKPVAPEIQQLIRRLSKGNPLWGAARIRDVLLLLDYDAPGCRCQPPVEPAGEPRGGTADTPTRRDKHAFRLTGGTIRTSRPTAPPPRAWRWLDEAVRHCVAEHTLRVGEWPERRAWLQTARARRLAAVIVGVRPRANRYPPSTPEARLVSPRKMPSRR